MEKEFTYLRPTVNHAFGWMAQDIHPQMKPLLGTGPEQGLEQILVAAYSDYLKAETDLKVPDFVKAPRQELAEPGVTLWSDMLAAKRRPGPVNGPLNLPNEDELPPGEGDLPPRPDDVNLRDEPFPPDEQDGPPLEEIGYTD